MRQLSFTSNKFGVEPGEEERTNPGRFGKHLAKWLKQKLVEKGRIIEEDVIPEDWGWVVMVRRKPFLLWVGCGNEDGSTEQWKVFVEAEQRFISKLLKKENTKALRYQLEEELEQIIKQEPEISDAVWEEM